MLSILSSLWYLKTGPLTEEWHGDRNQNTIVISRVTFYALNHKWENNRKKQNNNKFQDLLKLESSFKPQQMIEELVCLDFIELMNLLNKLEFF